MNKIKVGVIGTGFAKSVQIPSFLACDGAEIVSVASGSLANAESTAAEFNIPHFTGDWRETVDRSDLVCITTPPILHREMTVYALEQNKHVLCEKPMAMNVAEAEEMWNLAEQKNVLALIDHELRFQDGRKKAKAMLHHGAIGKVRHAKYYFQAPHRGSPEIPWNWWSDKEQGGGALGAVASHMIDSFHWFLDTGISEVFCQLRAHIKERPFEGGMRAVTSDDECNLVLNLFDGPVTKDASALLSVSMTEYPKYKNTVEFYGSEGTIRVEHRGEIFIAKAGEPDFTEIAVDTRSAVGGVADTGFSRGFMQFAPEIIRAILEGRRTIENAATFVDGVAVQCVLDAARQSDAERRMVSVLK